MKNFILYSVQVLDTLAEPIEMSLSVSEGDVATLKELIQSISWANTDKYVLFRYFDFTPLQGIQEEVYHGGEKLKSGTIYYQSGEDGVRLLLK